MMYILYTSTHYEKSRRVNRNLERKQERRRSIESCSAAAFLFPLQLFPFQNFPSRLFFHICLHLGRPWPLFPPCRLLFSFLLGNESGFVKRYNNAAGWPNSIKNFLSSLRDRRKLDSLSFSNSDKKFLNHDIILQSVREMLKLRYIYIWVYDEQL